MQRAREMRKMTRNMEKKEERRGKTAIVGMAFIQEKAWKMVGLDHLQFLRTYRHVQERFSRYVFQFYFFFSEVAFFSSRD